jgi:predicted component of type VI protein secretion system
MNEKGCDKLAKVLNELGFEITEHELFAAVLEMKHQKRVERLRETLAQDLADVFNQRKFGTTNSMGAYEYGARDFVLMLFPRLRGRVNCEQAQTISRCNSAPEF